MTLRHGGTGTGEQLPQVAHSFREVAQGQVAEGVRERLRDSRQIRRHHNDKHDSRDGDEHESVHMVGGVAKEPAHGLSPFVIYMNTALDSNIKARVVPTY